MVDRRRVSTLLGTRLSNPMVKAATTTGLAVPGIAILETTGRNSGQPRRTPVAFVPFWGPAHLYSRRGLASLDLRDLPAKTAVKLMIHKGALLADPHEAMEGKDRYPRAVAFRAPDEINPDVVAPILREAAARQTEMLPS